MGDEPNNFPKNSGNNINVVATAKDSSAQIDIGGHRSMQKTGSKKIVITVTNGSNKAFYTFELVLHWES